MLNQEMKCCPRCAIAFECKRSAIAQCQCNGISINFEEQAYISKQFDDCLCLACIKALRAEFYTGNFQFN